MRPSSEAKLLPLDMINEPPHQLRLSFDADALRALADDMAVRGLLQRIRVHPAPDTGRFTICVGHRRYLAARLIHWHTIPADVTPPCHDCSGDAASENLNRSDLTPLEEALFLQRLYQRDGDTIALAHITRRSVPWVEARLALLTYPEDLKHAIHTEHLPLAVAALLAQIDHDPYRQHLLRDALDNGASARTVAVWVQHYHANAPRLRHNLDTVEAVAAQRSDFKVLAPCDYCGDHEQLEHTRTWRLCSRCTAGLRTARQQPA